MLTYQTITVGDDLPFRASRVTSGRTNLLAPDAILTYQLLHKQERTLVAQGTMTLVDRPTATFEGLIVKPAVISGELYTLNIKIENAGSETMVSQDAFAVLDNLIANKDRVIAPGMFTIGDDLPIRGVNLISGKTGLPVPIDTIVTYALLNIQTRAVIATGPMYRYENASYEAVIQSDKTALASVEEHYVLHIIIEDAGILTTLAAAIDASLDPIMYQH